MSWGRRARARVRDRVRWAWRLFWARRRADFWAACSLRHVPDYRRAVIEVHGLEGEGVRRGWMLERDRTALVR